MTTLIQYWRCVMCAVEGETEMPGNIDVTSAVNLLGEDHDSLSPDCHARRGAKFIRLREFVATQPAEGGEEKR